MSIDAPTTRTSDIKPDPSISNGKAGISAETPRERLQAEATKLTSYLGIKILLDGKEADLLKLMLQPEGITVEEKLRKFKVSGTGDASLLADKESKSIIERIIESFKSRNVVASITEKTQAELRIYLENLLAQNLEESKNANSSKESEERKLKEQQRQTESFRREIEDSLERFVIARRSGSESSRISNAKLSQAQSESLDLVSDIITRNIEVENASKDYQKRLYELKLEENLGHADSHRLEELKKQSEAARTKLLQLSAGMNLEADIDKLTSDTSVKAYEAAQKIVDTYIKIKEGISNGWDLALLVQNLSKSEWTHLSRYFKERDSEAREIWKHTEKKLWWNKDKGREAHSGALCNASEFEATGLKDLAYRGLPDKAKIAENLINNKPDNRVIQAINSPNALLEIVLIRNEIGSKALKAILEGLPNVNSDIMNLATDQNLNIEEIARRSIQDFNQRCTVAGSRSVSLASEDAEGSIARISRLKSDLENDQVDLEKKLEALGLKTEALDTIRESAWQAGQDNSIKLRFAELNFQKNLELKVISDSQFKHIRDQADTDAKKWDQRIEEFSSNLRVAGLLDSQTQTRLKLDEIVLQASAMAINRAQELNKSCRNVYQHTEERLGTGEEECWAALKDKDGKFYSATEIALLNRKYKIEYGKSLDDQLLAEFSGMDLVRSFAIVNRDEATISACDLHKELNKFFGPDTEAIAKVTLSYANSDDSFKQRMDSVLKDRAKLTFSADGAVPVSVNGMEDVVEHLLRDSNKELAKTILTAVSPEDQPKKDARIMAIRVESHRHWYGNDYIAMGKLLEEQLIKYGNPLDPDKPLTLGEIDREKAALINEEFKKLTGKSLLERFNGSSADEHWVSSLIRAESLASVDSAKAALACENNLILPDNKDLKLALSVLDRGATENSGGILTVIMNCQDPVLREAKLKEYQALLSAHVKKIDYNGQGLSEIFANAGGPEENARILKCYTDFVFQSVDKMKTEEFREMGSVLNLHLAMRNKIWKSDDKVVLAELNQKSNSELRLKADTYEKMVGHRLHDDLDDQLADRYAKRGQFYLEGEPEFDGTNTKAYLLAIRQRMETRYQLEADNSGSWLTYLNPYNHFAAVSQGKKAYGEAQISINRFLGGTAFDDMHNTYHQNVKLYDSIINKLDRENISETESKELVRELTEFTSNYQHFRNIADINFEAKDRKAQSVTNFATTAVVVVVGLVTAIPSGGASLGWSTVMLSGLWTAGAGFVTRFGTKLLFYGVGGYDFAKDLRQDAATSAIEGAAAVGAAGVMQLANKAMSGITAAYYRAMANTSSAAQQGVSQLGASAGATAATQGGTNAASSTVATTTTQAGANAAATTGATQAGTSAATSAGTAVTTQTTTTVVATTTGNQSVLGLSGVGLQNTMTGSTSAANGLSMTVNLGGNAASSTVSSISGASLKGVANVATETLSVGASTVVLSTDVKVAVSNWLQTVANTAGKDPALLAQIQSKIPGATLESIQAGRHNIGQLLEAVGRHPDKLQSKLYNIISKADINEVLKPIRFSAVQSSTDDFVTQVVQKTTIARTAATDLSSQAARSSATAATQSATRSTSAIINPVTGQKVQTCYSYIANEALDNPKLLSYLQSRIPGLTSRNLEKELSNMTISQLRGILKQGAGKSYLRAFDNVNINFMQVHFASSLSRASRMGVSALAGGVRSGANFGSMNAIITAASPANWDQGGLQGVVQRSVLAFGQGAAFGFILGGAAGAISGFLSRTTKMSEVISPEKIQERLAKRRWFSDRPVYDSAEIAKALKNQGGVLHEANFVMARDSATKHWLSMTDWYHKLKMRRAIGLMENASSKTKAAWNVHDAWGKGNFASADDLLVLTGKSSEPTSFLGRKFFEWNVAIRARWHGNMNITPHQAAVADEVAKKGFISRYDVMQFRKIAGPNSRLVEIAKNTRQAMHEAAEAGNKSLADAYLKKAYENVSNMGYVSPYEMMQFRRVLAGYTESVVVDSFAKRYGFWMAGNNAVSDFSFKSGNHLAEKIWMRNNAVSANYQNPLFSGRFFEVSLPVFLRRQTGAAMAAMQALTFVPKANANNFDVLVQEKAPISMMVEARSLGSSKVAGALDHAETTLVKSGKGSIKADSVVDDFYQSSKFSKATQVGESRNSIESVIHVDKAADAIKHSGKKVDVVSKKSTDLLDQSFAGYVNHAFTQDAARDMDQLRMQQQQIQEQQSILRQIVQQQQVHAKVAEPSRQRSVAKKPKPLIDPPDGSFSEEKKKRKEEVDPEVMLPEKIKKWLLEESERIARMDPNKIRPTRKVFFFDPSVKARKVAIERLLDDGRWERISERQLDESDALENLAQAKRSKADKKDLF